MKRILIVEDDPVAEAIVAGQLKKAGYEVHVAPDAVTAIETAISHPPDLLLLDISFPAGNGFTVAARIQKLLPIAVPCVFLTVSRDPALRERAQAFGAAFLQKPCATTELLATIQIAFAGVLAPEPEEVYVL